MLRRVGWPALFSATFCLACGTASSSGTSLLGTGGSSSGGVTSGGPTPTAGASGASAAPGGSGGSSGAASVSGGGGQAATGGIGGAPASGSGGAISSGGAATVTCSQAATPYALSSVTLDPSWVPHLTTQGFNSSLFAAVPVAVNAVSGEVFVGFTRDTGGGNLAGTIVAASATATAAAVSIPGAAIGGIAVTNNGFGALLFDPNDNVDARAWAAVQRFDASGSELFATDLFRSPNLTDENTKGAPDTSRFGYVPASDQLVAYFGHTEMIQGVRHQGGYLATLDAAGVQTVVSGWWGSHNLDQRLLVSGSQVALAGLGDAFPKGIFFSFLVSRPKTQVLYTLAGNGQGNTNGQLGGIADLDDVLVLPFITNDSISQTLTPGDWPNIDQTIASQISAAAANGNRLGLLIVPKTGSLPTGDLTPIWLDPGLSAGAHLERLKAVRYGGGSLVLLAWSEATGTGRNVTRNYFTMTVDRNGGVCQPKTPLPAADAFMPGDDPVRRPDGSIVWANIINNRISVVTLTPQ
jgi:hypothetical protein